MANYGYAIIQRHICPPPYGAIRERKGKRRKIMEDDIQAVSNGVAKNNLGPYLQNDEQMLTGDIRNNG